MISTAYVVKQGVGCLAATSWVAHTRVHPTPFSNKMRRNDVLALLSARNQEADRRRESRPKVLRFFVGHRMFGKLDFTMLLKACRRAVSQSICVWRASSFPSLTHCCTHVSVMAGRQRDPPLMKSRT